MEETPPKKKWKRKTFGSGQGRKLTPEQREKAIKNLKPIKPGEIRNPKGKPVGTPNMTSALRNAIQEVITFPDPLYVPKKLKKGEAAEPVPMVTMKIMDIINRGLLAAALRGELPSTESVYRKVDGTPDQIIQTNMVDNKSLEEEDEEILRLWEDE